MCPPLPEQQYLAGPVASLACREVRGTCSICPGKEVEGSVPVAASQPMIRPTLERPATA